MQVGSRSVGTGTGTGTDMQSRRKYPVLIHLVTSVGDPDASDRYVLGPPGSGSGFVSQRYGSGSFYHQAKIVRKTMIPTVL
jgi:hypothetical protein